MIGADVLPLGDGLRNHLYEVPQLERLVGYSLEEGGLPNADVPLDAEGEPLLQGRLCAGVRVLLQLLVHSLLDEGGDAFGVVLVDDSHRAL